MEQKTTLTFDAHEFARLLAALSIAGVASDDPLYVKFDHARLNLQARPAPYKWICETCHGTNIVFDGNLEWNPELGAYVACDPFDDAWCSDCQGECNGVAVPIAWKEGDPVVDIFARKAA